MCRLPVMHCWTAALPPVASMLNKTLTMSDNYVTITSPLLVDNGFIILCAAQYLYSTQNILTHMRLNPSLCLFMVPFITTWSVCALLL